jgi:hypothetical protein
MRFAFIGLISCILAVPVIGVALLWFQPRPPYDLEHPDYAAFALQFQQAERAFAAGEDWAVINLAPLNGGAWRTACLFGGYTQPIQHLEAIGAIVSDRDRRRLSNAIGWRVAPVEEFEMLIAFSDEQGQGNFIHFNHGVGSEGQHYEACVTKPKTKVAIASWRTEPPRTPPPVLD